MRPIKNNQYGMKIPHLFNLYLVLKKLNPKLIVESGILAGQGTWLMQNACPEAKIISFDITCVTKEIIIVFHNINEFYLCPI